MVDEARSQVSRRVFMTTSSVGGIGLAGTLLSDRLDAQNGSDRPGGPRPPTSSADVPPLIRALKPMTGGIVPIADPERLQRIEKAQRLMREQRIDAVLLEGGSSLHYFTGVRWGVSERPFVAIIPASGALAWVCPAFEEARARELIRFGTDVRTWEEDESPYQRIAEVLHDRSLTVGRVGIEERLRFFIFDGVRRQAPGLEFVSADPVSAGCRMFKSPAELAIMQRANEITLAAYKATLSTLREGMTLQDCRRNLFAAYNALGAPEAAVLASFGRYTAYPHGSTAPQQLREGDVVLVDDGCSIEGYQSDVTRTVVFGRPTAHQLEVWNLEKRAQAAARLEGVIADGNLLERVERGAQKLRRLFNERFGGEKKERNCPEDRQETAD
jgi:Xaa-Pro dipeptidase